MVSIEELYRNCSILADAKEKAGQNVAAYKVIMSGVKSGPSQKRLASQFIARFSRHFPQLADDSLEAIFDLCEDEDFDIMKQAVRDLPQLCKDSIEYSQRAAYILLQLLASVLPSEQSIVSMSLFAILKTNTKETLKHVFELISEEENLRHQAFVFLHNKLKSLLSFNSSKEIEEIVVVHCKKLIGKVSDEDCLPLIQMLKTLPSMSTLTGRLHLLDIISQRLDSSFPPGDKEHAYQAMKFLKEADGLFSKNVQSTTFVRFLCKNILQAVNAKDVLDGEKELHKELLQLLAGMIAHTDDFDCCDECLTIVYDALTHIVQNPVMNNVQDPLETLETDAYPADKMVEIECILFTLRHMCSHCPQFLTLPENVERLKDLRVRLQFVSRVVQMCMKRPQNKMGICQTSDQQKSFETMMNNINSLIKDFFHNPPSFKSTVTLSFKTVPSMEKTQSSASGSKKQKLFSPISFEANPDMKRPKLLQSAQQQTQSSHSAADIHGLLTNINKPKFVHPAQQVWESSQADVGIRGQAVNRSTKGPYQRHPFRMRGQGRGKDPSLAASSVSVQAFSLQNNSRRFNHAPQLRGRRRSLTQRKRPSSSHPSFHGQANEVGNSFSHRLSGAGDIMPPSMNLPPQLPSTTGMPQRWVQMNDGQRKVVLKNTGIDERNFGGSW